MSDKDIKMITDRLRDLIIVILTVGFWLVIAIIFAPC